MTENTFFGMAQMNLDAAKEAAADGDYASVKHEVEDAMTNVEDARETPHKDAYMKAARQILSEIQNGNPETVERCLDRMETELNGMDS